eukprot:366470-Chlamydomonas_euryale.AAC.13
MHVTTGKVHICCSLPCLCTPGHACAHLAMLVHTWPCLCTPGHACAHLASGECRWRTHRRMQGCSSPVCVCMLRDEVHVCRSV